MDNSINGFIPYLSLQLFFNIFNLNSIRLYWYRKVTKARILVKTYFIGKNSDPVSI